VKIPCKFHRDCSSHYWDIVVTRSVHMNGKTNKRTKNIMKLNGKYLPHLLFCGPLVLNFLTKLFRKQTPFFVNNRRFTEFFDRYFHIPLPIVMKHELGLPFPPRNLRIKFGANPSSIFWVIVVTHRHTHTHKPTPVKTYSLALAGIKIMSSSRLSNRKGIQTKKKGNK